LVDGARVAVEQEARAGVVGGQALADHRVRDLVRDVLTGVHVPLRGPPQVGPGGDLGTEDVAGRDGGDTETTGEQLGMGSLAGSGRTHQDDGRHSRYP
jgi:hypothetical protein